MERTIRRDDIYYAELNPVVGSEQGGTRPVLIISNNNMGNRHSPTVTIINNTKLFIQPIVFPTCFYKQFFHAEFFQNTL